MVEDDIKLKKGYKKVAQQDQNLEQTNSNVKMIDSKWDILKRLGPLQFL